MLCLRRTAFEVLRTAYEQARAVRQQVEDQARTAVQDYEITLHHHRQRERVELAHVMQAAAESGQAAAVEAAEKLATDEACTPARARPEGAHGVLAPDAGDEPDGQEPVASVSVSESAEACGLGNRPLR